MKHFDCSLTVRTLIDLKLKAGEGVGWRWHEDMPGLEHAREYWVKVSDGRTLTDEHVHERGLHFEAEAEGAAAKALAQSAIKNYRTEAAGEALDYLQPPATVAMGTPGTTAGWRSPAVHGDRAHDPLSPPARQLSHASPVSQSHMALGQGPANLERTEQETETLRLGKLAWDKAQKAKSDKAQKAKDAIERRDENKRARERLQKLPCTRASKWITQAKIMMEACKENWKACDDVDTSMDLQSEERSMWSSKFKRLHAEFVTHRKTADTIVADGETGDEEHGDTLLKTLGDFMNEFKRQKSMYDSTCRSNKRKK